MIPFPARREGPPGTRGCGRVIVAHPAHAEAAVQALGGRFVWPGAEWPFQVQPYNPPALGGASDVRRAAAAAAAAAAAGAAAAAHFKMVPTSRTPPPPGALGGLLPAAAGASAAPRTGTPSPPPGCEPDAYPLILTNLPPFVDESELRAMLASYGRVVALDLAPGGVAASAGVWFASRAQADAAAAALTGALLRSAGEEPRQLQVNAGQLLPVRGDVAACPGPAAGAGAVGAGLGGGAGVLAAHGGGGDAPWPLSDTAGLQPLGQGFLRSLLGSEDPAGGHGPLLQQQTPWQHPLHPVGGLSQPWRQPPVSTAAASGPLNAWGPLASSQHAQAALGQPYLGLGFGLSGASRFGALSSSSPPAAASTITSAPAASPPPATDGQTGSVTVPKPALAPGCASLTDGPQEPPAASAGPESYSSSPTKSAGTCAAASGSCEAANQRLPSAVAGPSLTAIAADPKA